MALEPGNTHVHRRCTQLQHGYTCLDKVTAVEAAAVGAGTGELAAAQANVRALSETSQFLWMTG